MSAFGALLGQRLRRDRWQLLAWTVGVLALAGAAYQGVEQSFGTDADRATLLATVMAQRVILLFRGLPSGTATPAFTVFLILPFLVMLAAFMSTFLAVRHTRAEEESGRGELVAATGAGRVVPLVATAAEGAIANAVLGAVTAGVFVAVGFPVGGCLVAGAATAAAGLTFLGVGLVAAQLLPTARGANATGVWVVMATYLAAGVGNALGTPTDDLQRLSPTGLVWSSPFGWAEQSRPFDGDLVAPVGLCLAAAVALVAVAVVLQQARDLGASVLPERSGRAAARRGLSSPIGLVWRLTAPSLVGWAAGGLAVGLLATSLSTTLQSVAEDIPSVKALIEGLGAGGSFAQAAVEIFFTMLGVLAACCGVQTVCRARQEEARGTAEPVLSTPVGRVRWLAGYLVVALAGVVTVVVAAGVGAAIGIVAQGRPDLWRVVLAVGGGQAVAALVFVVLTAVAFVMVPRATIAVGWTLVILGTMLGLFGPLFGLPDWVVHLAPIADTPTMTDDGVDLRGLWWLALAVVAGGALALVAMRRRELTPAG